MTEYTALVTDFRPLSRGSFFNVNVVCWDNVAQAVFVPFLGDFFQLLIYFSQTSPLNCFRPLSRGLFFNAEIDALNAKMDAIMFSSPFSGTFFQ